MELSLLKVILFLIGAGLFIFNIQGKLMYENKIINTTIDLSHFSKGTYFIKIESGESVINKKFIKN